MEPTPKQKAKALYDKFLDRMSDLDFGFRAEEAARKCVFICCEEVILEKYNEMKNMFDEDFAEANIEEQSKFWYEVAKETENL